MLLDVSFNGNLNKGIISTHANGNETAYLSTSQLRKIYVEPITRLKKHSNSLSYKSLLAACAHFQYVLYIVL